MTRHHLKIGAMLLALVVGLGLLVGYVVGSLAGPTDTQILSSPPVEPATFKDAASRDGGGPTVDGIPTWADLYVNDYEDMLSDGAEDRIRAQLIELYDRTGVEMTVLTISEMIAYGHGGTIEEFATKLFNAWGIGNAATNNGVLILVSRYDRQMRIELGAGYGRDRDADMQRVIDTAFLPDFRSDDYEAGIIRGVEATVFEIAGRYPGGYDQSTVETGWSVVIHWLWGLGAIILAPVLAGAGLIWIAIQRYLRNRPRPCPDCRTLMLKASEEADDAHLDGGQRLEEYLKSINYDVWHCPNCAHISIHGYKHWFSGYSACPQCNYRTLETTSEVLTAATTSSTGKKRLDYHCKNCGHSDHEIRTIPKVSKSSSSGGGSSRSSFGGGSSSGGGASGSW